MLSRPGIAVSPGVAMGEALVIDHEGFRIPRRFVVRDAVDEELRRLNDAIDSVSAEVDEQRQTVSNQLGESYGMIFAAHLQMLRDPQLREELERGIREQHFSPEYAVSRTLRRYAKVFQQVDEGHVAEKAHDLFDLERSLLGALLGRRREELSQLAAPVVILAHNLTPSETARFDPNFVLGFATEIGGPGGHTSIVAQALGIPAVVGIGQFLTDVSGGEQVIVDGDIGQVILQPDEESLQRSVRSADIHRTTRAELAALSDLSAVTLDDVSINIHANVEFPHEIQQALDHGAKGVGLYRTEFLYLNAPGEPSEDDHFEAYERVVRTMAGRPVVMRTLDLGGDKMGQLPRAEEEQNPFLGLRSIRLSLRDQGPFLTQLKAILRASGLGNVKIMFPLISTLQELREAKLVLKKAMEELDRAGIEFDSEIPVGMMVEVPSAVVMIESFLQEVDFISIGTNDLVQYTLAVDRANRYVANLYSNSDPSVLRLISQALEAAQRANIPASLCGQMGGDVVYAMLLLGMGLREWSVPPSVIPEIKQVCRKVKLTQCEQLYGEVMQLDNPHAIDKHLRQELQKVLPEQTVF